MLINVWQAFAKPDEKENENLEIMNHDVVSPEGSRRTRWVGLVTMATVGEREDG